MDTNTSKHNIPIEIERLRGLVALMDNKFTLPFTKFKFGIDPLLNLLPGAGQAIDVGISLYIAFALMRNGTSGELVGKMLWNILLDSVVSSIPLVGYIFDFAFKANRRNLLLAEEYYQQGLHQGSGVKYFLPFVFLFIAGLLLIAIASYMIIKFMLALLY